MDHKQPIVQISFFYLKISKFTENSGWNIKKGVQVGNFSKFNKICCIIFWKTKVTAPTNLVLVGNKYSERSTQQCV